MIYTPKGGYISNRHGSLRPWRGSAASIRGSEMIEKLRRQLENDETPSKGDLLRLLVRLERMQDREAELGVDRVDQATYIRKLEKDNEQLEDLVRKYRDYIKKLEAVIRTVRSVTEGVTRAR